MRELLFGLAALGFLVTVALYRRATPAQRANGEGKIGLVALATLVLFVVGMITPSAVRTVDAVAPAARSAPAPRTDLQNLAVIAGRSEDDAELNAQYERLVALCPPEGPSVGDMAVNLQQLVKRESGRDMDIVDVMRQLATAQEGGVTMGMKCSETGGMLAELLIKGM